MSLLLLHVQTWLQWVLWFKSIKLTHTTLLLPEKIRITVLIKLLEQVIS